MRKITFFTKVDCTLCTGALYVVKRVKQGIDFELEIVDIAEPGNEIWFEQYRNDIPVVHLDGQEIFRHRVNERSLRAWLANNES